MLPWYQSAALILVAFLFGSIQVSGSRRVKIVVGLAKGLAIGWILQSILAADYQGGKALWLQQFTVLEQSILSGAALAVLLGDRFPLGYWFNRTLRSSEQWSTLLGLVVALNVGLTGRAGLVTSTVALVAFVLIQAVQKNLGALLPLVALVPVGIGMVGQFALASYVAYGLFGVFLLVELLRLWRPAFNRRLIRIPGLLGERELNRPLGASGAVTVVALLVDFLPAEQLAVVALLGVTSISFAKALVQYLPFGQKKLWRDVSRGFALALFVGAIVVLPATMLITAVEPRATIFAALAVLIAALLPLPIDRYILAPLAAAGILFALA